MALETVRWVLLGVIDMTLRGAVVLAVCAATVVALRRSSAALRHAVWSSGLIAMAALPLAAVLLPALRVPLLPEIAWLARPATAQSLAGARGNVALDGEEMSGAHASPTEVAAEPSVSDAGGDVGRGSVWSGTDWALLLLAGWSAGFAWFSWRLIRAIVVVRRLVREAQPAPALVRALACEVARGMGCARRIDVRRSPALSVPVTSGWIWPRVVLPRGCHEWPISRLRSVLAHEIGHVARFDCVTHSLVQAGCALHWLNPLAWLAARRARLEREQACDDLVLRYGTRATDYAADLLTIARSLPRRGALTAAVAMASPSDLERRLVSVLTPDCARQGLRGGVVLLSVMLTAVVVCTAAAVDPWRSDSGAGIRARTGIQLQGQERESSMTRSLISGLAAAALVTGAPAQERDRPSQERGNPRVERAERGVRGERGDRAGGLDRMFERLARELNLDEQQRARFDELVAEQRERMRAARGQREGGPEGERGDGVRPEGRPERGRFGGGDPMAQFYEELRPLLNEEQVAKLDELRADMMRRRGGDRGGMSRRITEELPAELGLDEQQRAQFDELAETLRRHEREQFEASRPMFEQMREARDAGDEEKMQALREEMERSRRDREGPVNEFFDGLESILRDDQKQRLAQYREELSSRGRRDSGTDVRSILRAARRLELTDEQKDALRDIEREAGEQAREVRGDREAGAKLAAEVKEKVANLLDDEQRTQFENSLRREGRRGRPQREPR